MTNRYPKFPGGSQDFGGLSRGYSSTNISPQNLFDFQRSRSGRVGTGFRGSSARAAVRRTLTPAQFQAVEYRIKGLVYDAVWQARRNGMVMSSVEVARFASSLWANIAMAAMMFNALALLYEFGPFTPAWWASLVPAHYDLTGKWTEVTNSAYPYNPSVVTGSPSGGDIGDHTGSFDITLWGYNWPGTGGPPPTGMGLKSVGQTNTFTGQTGPGSRVDLVRARHPHPSFGHNYMQGLGVRAFTRIAGAEAAPTWIPLRFPIIAEPSLADTPLVWADPSVRPVVGFQTDTRPLPYEAIKPRDAARPREDVAADPRTDPDTSSSSGRDPTRPRAPLSGHGQHGYPKPPTRSPRVPPVRPPPAGKKEQKFVLKWKGTVTKLYGTITEIDDAIDCIHDAGLPRDLQDHSGGTQAISILRKTGAILDNWNRVDWGAAGECLVINGVTDRIIGQLQARRYGGGYPRPVGTGTDLGNFSNIGL